MLLLKQCTEHNKQQILAKQNLNVFLRKDFSGKRAYSCTVIEVTLCMLDDLGFIHGGYRNYSLCHHVHTSSNPMGTEGLFHRIKWPEHKADLSPVPSDRVRNT
jgi:hypothetical protein